MSKIHSSILSEIILPALLAGVLGYALAAHAASFSVTTTFVNAAPSFSVAPSDGGSSTSTPTNVGTNITFTATATDSNHDSYWLAICKTGGSITPSGSGGAPTCTAGNWCISSSAVSGDGSHANTCAYTTQQSDSQTDNWEAYVCDNRTPSLCSAANTGSGSTGSPFGVNHPPVIGTIYAGSSYGSNASVDPGNGGTGAVYFQAGVTDPDTGNTIDMYVCTNATTSFDPSTGTCTGGSTICSQTGVSSGGNAQCTSNLAPIPTAHGSNPVKIWLRDNSSTKMANTVSTPSYTVTDVTPTISSFSFTGGYTTLSPVMNSSVNQVFSATLTDNNGYTDITLPVGAIYVSPATLNSSGQCSTASEINCYNATGNCAFSNGSGASVTVTCGGSGNLITTWYNIAPSSSWKAHMATTSDLGVTSYSTEGTFTVNTANYMEFSETTVAYGTLQAGQTSSSQTTTFLNEGNIINDALISGSNMCTDYPTCSSTPPLSPISRSQEHWSPVSSWTWGTSDYALVQTASVGSAVNGCSDRTIAVTTAHATPTSSAIYWKIQIPNPQPTGTYPGSMTVSPTPNDCSGGV